MASRANAAELNINGLSQCAAADQVTDAISITPAIYYLLNHKAVIQDLAKRFSNWAAC